MSSSDRPLASLSLDLDNQWAYMKTHGDQGWQDFPSYLDHAVPQILQLLASLDLRMTCFVVGQDAALPRNHPVLASIPAAGHEIGCHSFHHDPWLHCSTPEEVDRELADAERAIEEATGVRPDGFRGPGFSVAPAVLQCLHDRGYRYDASILPTYLGPVCRAYYFWKSDLDAEERTRLSQLYAPLERGRWPLRPYLWELAEGSLLEVPVTTLPGLRLPFHLSYLLYLSTFSPWLARTYFRTALRLCALRGHEPSVLVHPLDLLGGDEVPELSFFPGMNLNGSVKRRRVHQFLEELARRFEVLPMGGYVDRVLQREALRRVPASKTEPRRRATA